jgi:hypothetical protein
MEKSDHQIESLVQRLEVYGKTSLELLKLQAIDKTTDVFSKLIAHIFTTTFYIFSLVFFSISIAIYLGEYYGENYYGFLIVSFFYVALALIMSLFKKKIKKKVKDLILPHILN